MSYFADHAAQLVALGYRPIPLEPQSKSTNLPGWTRYEFKPTDIQRFQRHGVGLLTEWMPTCDVDVRKAELAEALQSLALEMLGPAPVRVGATPKRALIYRCTEPFCKLRTRSFRLSTDAPDDKPHLVEFLGKGQQVVAYAIHPDTGRPYEWVSGSDPLTRNFSDLIEVTEAQVREYLRAAEALIDEDPETTWLSPLSEQIEGHLRERSHVEQTSRNPARTREQLHYIPNNVEVDYDGWIRMMLAVKGALGHEGADDFIRWSAKSPKHVEVFTRREFERCTPRSIGAGTIEYVAREHGWRPQEERIFNRENARLDIGRTIAPPKWIYPGYLPLGTAGGMTAEGGTSKTTFTLFEAIHIGLGRPFLGRELSNGGNVLFVTAEDEMDILAHRLKEMAKEMELTLEEIQEIEASIFIEDISGMMLRLVEVDERSNLRRTKMGDRLIDEYKGAGIALINLDPTNLFGPGERFVNDSEATMMVEGMRIARELGCTVRFIHHVAKAVARSDIVDQYAGRGGAAFADNSRFQHHLVLHAGASNSGNANRHYAVPNAIDPNVIAEERVIRLHTTKLSWAKRPVDPIWLIRDGFTFKSIMPERISNQERADVQEAVAAERIVEYIRRKLAEGVKLSMKQLTEEHFRILDLTRSATKRIVHELEQRGRLVFKNLPPEECRGPRKTYLAVGTTNCQAGEAF
jgi:hypothetical protein